MPRNTTGISDCRDVANGTKRTCRDVRYESVMRSKADIPMLSNNPGRCVVGRPSRPIHSDRRVKVLEFDTCVGGCKLPVGLGEVGIAVVLPSGDFLDEGLLVGNPAVEALGR